jgi:hypothetical protein
MKLYCFLLYKHKRILQVAHTDFGLFPGVYRRDANTAFGLPFILIFPWLGVGFATVMAYQKQLDWLAYFRPATVMATAATTLVICIFSVVWLNYRIMNSTHYKTYILEFSEYSEMRRQVSNALFFLLLLANVWVPFLLLPIPLH